MPSAFPYRRTFEEDLQALGGYSRYRYTSHADRKLAREAALSGLKSYFFRYGHSFQTPRRLLASGRLRARALTEFLYGLYDSKSVQFRYIDELSEIEDLGVCLYCGLQKNITVDHYLPRKLKAFPHYSFLSLNLVPACSSCQSSKGSFYPSGKQPSSRTPAKGRRRAMTLRMHRDELTVAIRRPARSDDSAPTARLRSIVAKQRMMTVRIRETRRIIHPYLDRFLRGPAFDLDLEWSEGVPKIERFLWRPHITSAQGALLAFHLDLLEVKDRSRGHLRRMHLALAESATEHALDQHGIEKYVELLISNAEKKAGVANSIEAGYYKALRRDESRLASLAALSHHGKPQRLVPEATAVPVVKKRRLRHARALVY